MNTEKPNFGEFFSLQNVVEFIYRGDLLRVSAD